MPPSPAPALESVAARLDAVLDYLDELDRCPATWPRRLAWLALIPWWICRPFALGALEVGGGFLADALAAWRARKPVRVTRTGIDPRMWPVLFWLSLATGCAFAMAAVKHGWFA